MKGFLIAAAAGILVFVFALIASGSSSNGGQLPLGSSGSGGPAQDGGGNGSDPCSGTVGEASEGSNNLLSIGGPCNITIAQSLSCARPSGEGGETAEPGDVVTASLQAPLTDGSTMIFTAAAPNYQSGATELTGVSVYVYIENQGTTEIWQGNQGTVPVRFGNSWAFDVTLQPDPGTPTPAQPLQVRGSLPCLFSTS